MSQQPQTYPNDGRCRAHGAIDCACEDAPVLRLLPPWGPSGILTVVEVVQTPTGKREEVFHGLNPEAAFRLLAPFEDDPYGDAYCTDRDGTTWVVRRGEWEVLEEGGDGCGCGRGDCGWCGFDGGRAA